MGILDSLPGIVSAAFGTSLFRAAFIYRVQRSPNGRGGHTVVNDQYEVRGIVTEYTDYARIMNAIPAMDRKIIIAADGLTIVPKSDDFLVFEDEAWKAIAVERDPAGATYTIQARPFVPDDLELPTEEYQSILSTLPATIRAAMATTLFQSAYLYRPAGKTTNNRGGYTYISDQYACFAMVTEYTDLRRSADNIPSAQRQIILLADGLWVEPKTDDVIVIEERAWKAINVSRDPAKATYVWDAVSVGMPIIGVNAIGSITIPEFTFVAAANSAHAGVGAIEVGEFAFLGSIAAPESVEGTGALVYPFSFAGTALAHATAQGSWELGTFTFAGAASAGSQASAGLTYAFTFAGAARAAHAASGAFSVGEFAFNGLSTDGATGVGDFAYEFTFAGSALAEHDATAGLTYAFTFAGTARSAHAASGSFTIPEFVFSGESIDGASAAGDFAYDFTFAGSARSAHNATGAFTYEFAFDADAIADHEASAAFSYDFAFAGAARAAHAASGSFTIAEFTFDGDGVGRSTAIGAFTIPEFTFNSAGKAEHKATAGLTYSFTFAGTARAAHNASAAITIPNFTFAAQARAAHNATGSFTIPGFTFAGTGENPAPSGSVALDTTATTANVATASSQTFTSLINIGSNSNRYLVVFVAVAQNGSANLSGVTFNGDAMTLIDSIDESDQLLAAYGLLAPDTGSHNLVVTLSGSVEHAMNVSAISLYNVHQTTPRGTAEQTTTESTLTPPGDADGYPLSGTRYYRTDGTAAITSGAGQTRLTTTNAGIPELALAVDTEDGIDGDQALFFTYAGSIYAGQAIAFCVLPA